MSTDQLQNSTGTTAQARPVLTSVEVPPARPVLTHVEIQVLVGMSRGLTNAEIGRRLQVSDDTVKSRAARIFHKLGAVSRAHAVGIAYRKGVLRCP